MDSGTTFSPKMKFILMLIAVAAISRLFPHPENFSPIAAMALFAGAFIPGKKNAMWIPLVALLLSDILLQVFNNTGFYRDMFFVYGSFAAVVLIGKMIKDAASPGRVIMASLAASALFFLVTNFGTWLMYDIYSHDLPGLIKAYAAGIPFLRGTVLGDLFYSTILFGSFALARKRYPAIA